MVPVLLLVRRNATVTPFTVAAMRRKGFEPFVLSSRPDDGGDEFRQVCAELEVDCAVAAGVTVTADEVAAVLARLGDCAFCLSLADSQRPLMAEANRLIGIPDADPAALHGAVDKHAMRTSLTRLGLSRLRSLRLADPGTRAVIEGGEPFVVKPRRGAGSLCVGVVRSWAEAETLQRAFAEGPGDEDMMAEYFVGNELIAESFFDGQELSLDLVRRDGQNLLAVEHEKTVLEFGEGTVLERGMASPAVGLTPPQLVAARRLTDQVLEALGLTHGVYHVEVRVNSGNRAEIVEINPRVGGAMIFESIELQYDRSVTEDWIDILAGREIAPLASRRCGTYQQLAHVEQRRPLMAADTSASMPGPTVSLVHVTPGERSMPYRETFSASALWTTDLARHREQVAALMTEEYYRFRYLPGLSGQPVVLVLEPPGYEVVNAAAAMAATDLVIVHADPVAVIPEYLAVCDRIAALVRVPSWSEPDACLALIRQACGGSPVQAVFARQELTRPVADRIGVRPRESAIAH